MAEFSKYWGQPKAPGGPGGLCHTPLGHMTKLKTFLSSLSGKTLTYLSVHKEPEGAGDRLRQREAGQVGRCGGHQHLCGPSSEDLTLRVTPLTQQSVSWGR